MRCVTTPSSFSSLSDSEGLLLKWALSWQNQSPDCNKSELFSLELRLNLLKSSSLVNYLILWDKLTIGPFLKWIFALAAFPLIEKIHPSWKRPLSPALGIDSVMKGLYARTGRTRQYKNSTPHKISLVSLECSLVKRTKQSTIKDKAQYILQLNT